MFININPTEITSCHKLLIYLCVHLRLQSLAVKEAAYNCRWYTRTERFKYYILMILIRADKPVYLSAGALWKITIEFYSQVKPKLCHMKTNSLISSLSFLCGIADFM